jgi:hypothetical protein
LHDGTVVEDSRNAPRIALPPSITNGVECSTKHWAIAPDAESRGGVVPFDAAPPLDHS